MEEKKKQRHLGSASDGREEEAEALGWRQWWKRGRSGDAQSSYQLWQQSSKYHISNNRARTDGTGDGKSQCCCTENLMRHPPASDFGWRKKRLLSCPVEEKEGLEPLSPLSWLDRSKSRRYPRLLKRVLFLHPHPNHDHFTPKISVILIVGTLGTFEEVETWKTQGSANKNELSSTTRLI